MASSKIEWTEITWNPSTGCTKISAGCKNCYAERMANRLKAMGINKYRNGFKLTMHPNTLIEPYRWRKPSIVFVNSMSDIFHEHLPFSFIQSVFRVMNDNSQHIFQVLTKRPSILIDYHTKLNWTKNIWMGVTVEDHSQIYRIELLRKTNAKIKFISFEPLLTELPNLEFTGINWVIVGGESGPRARPIEENWVIDIYKNCKNKSIPFFFKQWGGYNKKQAGRRLNGKIYSEMPELYNLI